MSVDNSNENSKDEPKNENCVTKGIPEELKNFTKICNSRCSICHSSILPEVHKWKKQGLKLLEIVERAADEYNVKLSTAALCRHFKSYDKFKLEMATEIIKNDTIAEITAQSVHIKKTVELLDIAFEKVKAKLIAGSLGVDISDLEKLTKMRYQILNGENADDTNIAAIFQKASDEYGLNLQQGVLFKT